MFLLKICYHLGLVSKGKYDERIILENIKKSDFFDAKWYLAAYPDVARAKSDPARHYFVFGWKEGRNPSPKFDNNEYLKNYYDVASAGICPLVHFINCGQKEGRYAKPVDKNKLPKISVEKTSFAQRLKYMWEYPVRVQNKYHELKKQVKKLKSSK